jgi:CheY-like chemotaxis protein
VNKLPKVLVVDDSSFTHKILRTQLAGTGIDIVGDAANGEEALAIYDKVLPDIVLLDCIMPVMDGPATIAEMMKRTPRPTIIMLSSLGSETNVTRCLELGARSFIQKPFNRDGLLTVFAALGFHITEEVVS